jgi:hypothetical protein
MRKAFTLSVTLALPYDKEKQWFCQVFFWGTEKAFVKRFGNAEVWFDQAWNTNGRRVLRSPIPVGRGSRWFEKHIEF